MMFNSSFKEVNLCGAYKIASEIINLFNCKDIKEELDLFLSLEAREADEFLVNLIHTHLDCIMKPQQVSLLHFFISEYIEVFIGNEIYGTEDVLIDIDDYDTLIGSLQNILMLINDEEWENDELSKLEVIFQSRDDEIIDFDDSIKRLRAELTLLENKVAEAIDELTKNIFFLLYSNKGFLYDFNLVISDTIRNHHFDEDIYDDSGHIKRCTSRPKWLDNAIVFRDRCICQHCGKDLSPTFSVPQLSELTFDHVIPLEKGGTNDSTNFQLLCQHCNSSKNDSLHKPSYRYQMFW